HERGQPAARPGRTRPGRRPGRGHLRLPRRRARRRPASGPRHRPAAVPAPAPQDRPHPAPHPPRSPRPAARSRGVHMPLLTVPRILLAALFVAGPVTVLPAPAAQAATTYHVVLSGYAFAPRSLTITAGVTCTWPNPAQAPHD